MRIGDRTYNVKLGLTIFLAISVASAAGVLYLGVDRGTWSGLKLIKPQYGLLAIALALMQWLLNALRFQILVNSFEEKVSFWTSFKAFMANVFMAAMTPSQTGGGPLQIYVLNRAGVPVAKAFAGCLMGAVLTVACLIIANLGVLVFMRDLGSGFGHHMGTVFMVAFAVFLFLTVVFLVSLFKIGFIKRFFGGIVLFFSRHARVKGKYSVTKRLMRGLDQYSECMLAFAGAKKYRVMAAGLITMFGVCVNALMAPVLLAGLNIAQNVTQVLLLQFVILFITYFSPTPGASGIAEFSAYWLMASADIQQGMLGIYVVVWRFFTSFLGVGVGAVIVLSMIGRATPVKNPT